MALLDFVPPGSSPDEVLDGFVRWAADQGLDLYPHQ
jgi:hypothetical protein